LDGLAKNSDVASSCEHGDEPSVPIKFELFAKEILAFQEENNPCSQYFKSHVVNYNNKFCGGPCQ